MEKIFSGSGKSLGMLRTGEKRVVSFESSRDVRADIAEVEVGCKSCTEYLGYDGKDLRVLFRTPMKPIHLGNGLFEGSKRVYVRYKDGVEEKLEFRYQID